MLKKVEVHTTLVTLGENGRDVICTTARGGCLMQDGDVMLRYPEPDNNGTAHLLITAGLADLKRQGDVRSRLTFIERKMQPCHYVTSAGALNLDIFTHSQSLVLTDTGGSFEARYTVLVGGAHATDNELKVEFTFTE
ncbi:MAG: DUF1934 domain-containing protein [Bacteroidales bacterium]|nr:DUF1934 domain-containing protein [Bacteroidales bacterium]